MKIQNSAGAGIIPWRTPFVEIANVKWSNLPAPCGCGWSANSPPPTWITHPHHLIHISVGGGRGKPYQKPWRHPGRQRSLLAPHQPNRFICCKRQSSLSSLFVLGQSVLAFANHGLHLTCNSPHKNLFYRFPRDWSNTDGPVFFWILSEILLVDRSGISLLLVFSYVPQVPQLEDYGEWPCTCIGQLSVSECISV